MGGISANTPGRIVYGTDGFVTVNGTDLGATLGPIEIRMNAEHYYPDLAQARGPVAGTGKVTGGTFSVTVTLAEWDYDNLSAAMGSIGADSSGASEKFGGATLDDAVEVDNVIVTGITRKDGKAFVATIPKAYVEVGDITLEEGKEAGLQITFHGLYTTTSPDVLPGYIEIEK